jgi:hypothetical protein
VTNEDLLARLIEAHAARVDPLDLPTRREFNDYIAHTTALANLISNLRGAMEQVGATRGALEPWEAERDAWLAKREELRRQGDVAGIEHLERGTKWRNGGDVWPTLAYLDDVVREKRAKAHGARSLLGLYESQAEALLAAPVAG